MVNKCAAVGCKSRLGKTKTSFHRFPLRDPERLEKWLNICPPDLNLEKGVPALCSNHFLNENYVVVGNRKKLKHNAVPILIHSVRQISMDEQLQAQREIHPNSMNHPISNSTAFPISLATGQANSNVCPEIVHLSTTTKDTNQANQDAEDSDDCITVQVNMRDFGEDKESSDLSPHQTLILENIQLKSENQELKSQINQLKCRLFLLEKQVSQLGKIPENRNTHVKLTLNNHSPAIHSNK